MGSGRFETACLFVLASLVIALEAHRNLLLNLVWIGCNVGVLVHHVLNTPWLVHSA